MRIYLGLISVIISITTLFHPLRVDAMTNNNTISTSDTESCYTRGMAAMEKGDYIEALPLLLVYIEKSDPNGSTEQLKKLGRAYLKAASVYYYFCDYNSSIELNRKAVDTARRAGDNELEAMALCNQFTPLYYQNYIDEADKVNEQYYKFSRDKLRNFAYHMNKGCVLNKRGHKQQAVELFMKTLEILDRDSLPPFMKAYPLSELSTILIENHDEEGAIKTLRDYEAAISNASLEMRGVLLRDCYKGFVSAFMAKRNIDSVARYQKLYIQLTDSMLNTDRFLSVAGDVQRQIVVDKNRELSYMSLNLRHQRWMLAAAILIIIGVSVALVIILRQKRELHQRERALFNRNLELMRTEEELEEQEEEMHRQPVAWAEDADNNDAHIMKLIREAMENAEMWCDPDFDLPTLAASIHSNTKYVSQAINQTEGKNFRSYVNEYRVRLARKRFSSGGIYLQWSVAAMGESVGFRSSTSFSSAFQKYTGLSPASFRKMCADGISTTS